MGDGGFRGDGAVVPDFAGAAVLLQGAFPDRLPGIGIAESRLHAQEIDPAAAAPVQEVHQVADCFDVDAVETADAEPGQVGEE